MTTLSCLKIRHLKKYSFFAAGLSLVISFSGCGGSPTETAPSTPIASTPVSTPAAAANDEALVDQAVNDFMVALKSGNRQKAEALLTPASIVKTKEAGLVINPLGGDKMQFTIMEKQILQMTEGKWGAHVICEISDINEEGQVEKHQHLWALRKETDGWRIAGMAAEMFPGEQPVLFDFENAEDMVHQLKEIGAEMERRQNAATAAQTNVAQQPGQPSPSTQPSTTPGQSPATQQPAGQQPVLTAQQPMNPAQPTFTPQQPSTPNGQQPVAPMQQIPAASP